MSSENKVSLSLVIPVYNEAESLMPLYDAITEAMKPLIAPEGSVSQYDMWLINDGSSDGSEAIIRKLHEQDERVRLIAFRRNFGKAAALQAGFRHAEGDIVITMDADLQDEPSEIGRFIEKMQTEGLDLVSGWKKERHDPLEKRLPSKLFNRFTSRLSGIHLHDFNCGFKAYRREVVKSIDVYGELHRYVPVLAGRKGFRVGEMVVHHNARKFGKSKYGFERYLRGMFDSFTVAFLSKFYDRPMYFFGRIGVGFSGIGFLMCCYLLVCKLLGQSIGTRPMLLVGVMCLILGVNFICTGFIGDMLVDATYRKRYEESHVREVL